MVQRLLQLPPLQRAEAAGAAYGGSGVVCRAVHHFAFAACWQALGEPSLHLASRPPLRLHKHLTPRVGRRHEKKCMQNMICGNPEFPTLESSYRHDSL